MGLVYLPTIWLIFMVDVAKYIIHGSYGCQIPPTQPALSVYRRCEDPHAGQGGRTIPYVIGFLQTTLKKDSR